MHELTTEDKVASQTGGEMSQQGTFIHAVKWAFVTNWGRDGIGAAVTVILASILSPSDFGIVAIALVYIAFIQMLLGLGFDAAIIQRKGLKTLHLDSVFWLILMVSLLLTVVSVVLSRWWAHVNHAPDLALVICALSITIPIHGLVIIQQALFHRKMDFKSLALRDNAAALFSGFVGVGMALSGLGVWSLVGQQLSRAIISFLLLWKISNWRPKLRYSAQHVKDLLGFSITVFMGRFGTYLQGHSDALLMGLFFGPAAVGLYRLADRLMNMPLKLGTRGIHTVSLPYFSQLQEDRHKLKRSLLTCWRASSLMTIPFMVGIAAASDLLMTAIGPQWATAGDVLKILCVIGATKSITLFTGTLLQAVSKPNIQALMVWCLALSNTVAFIIVGILLDDASLEGQIIGIAGSRASLFVLLFMPINIMFAVRIAGITGYELLATVGPSILIGTLILLVVMVLKSTFAAIGLTPLVELVFTGIFAGSVGLGATIFLDRHVREYLSITRSKIRDRFLRRRQRESRHKKD